MTEGAARGTGGRELSRAPGPERGHHPLAPVLPLLHDTLVTIADETLHPMVVTDARGGVLWRETRPAVLRRIAPLPAAEHRPCHCWSGVASAVHDPDTGRVVGVLDVLGPALGHPTTAALVTAAARLVESVLAVQRAVAGGRPADREGHREAVPVR